MGEPSLRRADGRLRQRSAGPGVQPASPQLRKVGGQRTVGWNKKQLSQGDEPGPGAPPVLDGLVILQPQVAQPLLQSHTQDSQRGGGPSTFGD